VKLYSYPRCSTCRKAIAWLQARGIGTNPRGLDLIDITLQPPSPEELQRALDLLGRKRLLNTSGQSYRALGAATVQAMDDSTLLEALAADGKLIKRPFLILADGRIVTGFQQLEWEGLFS
jgi:arsenate reductase (glutaredoxin)